MQSPAPENPRGRGSAGAGGLALPGLAPIRVPALAGRLGGWFSACLAKERDHRSGFLWLPVAFGLGILAYFAADREPALWAGPLFALAAITGATRLGGAVRGLALALALVALGFSAGAFRTAYVQTPMLDRERFVEIKGFVETLDTLPHRQRLVLRPESIEGVAPEALPFRLRLGLPGKAGPAPGDFIALKARLAPPSEAALPGGYDFRREAYFRSIGGVGFALGAAKPAEAKEAAPLGLRVNAAIDRWRNALTHRIATTIGGDEGALAAALITGKRGLISDAANEDLRAAGLYHVVSISGLHMVLAAGVMFWSIRAVLAAIPAIALRHPIKKYAAAFAMAGATLYCVFSGSEVATERSLVMTLVMLGAILVDRPALAMRNLAISALIVLAREPEALLGPSFQMSYAAVGGLIAANQIWRDHGRHRAPLPPRGFIAGLPARLLIAFAGIIATTLVATIATAPFSAFHFHRLNPYGIIGNALGIPLVSLIVMPSAVLGTLLVPFGLDSIVWLLMGEGIAGMLAVARRVAAIENATVTAPHLKGLVFFLLVAALIILVLCRSGLRWLALAPAMLAFLLPSTRSLPDLVIDPAGRFALMRGEAGRYRLLAIGNPSKFTLSQWLPALDDPRPPDASSLRDGVRCDKSGCIARLGDGRVVALSQTPDSLREDCRLADVIVTALAAPSGCRNKMVIDRTHLERYGATMAMLGKDGSWHLQGALAPGKERPWRRPNAPSQASAETPAQPQQAPRRDIPRAEPGADDPALLPEAQEKAPLQ